MFRKNFEGDVRLTGGYEKKRKKKLIFVNLTFKVYDKNYICQIIKYKKYCNKINLLNNKKIGLKKNKKIVKKIKKGISFLYFSNDFIDCFYISRDL